MDAVQQQQQQDEFDKIVQALVSSTSGDGNLHTNFVVLDEGQANDAIGQAMEDTKRAIEERLTRLRQEMAKESNYEMTKRKTRREPKPKSDGEKMKAVIEKFFKKQAEDIYAMVGAKEVNNVQFYEVLLKWFLQCQEERSQVVNSLRYGPDAQYATDDQLNELFDAHDMNFLTFKVCSAVGGDDNDDDGVKTFPLSTPADSQEKEKDQSAKKDVLEILKKTEKISGIVKRNGKGKFTWADATPLHKYMKRTLWTAARDVDLSNAYFFVVEGKWYELPRLADRFFFGHDEEERVMKCVNEHTVSCWIMKGDRSKGPEVDFLPQSMAAHLRDSICIPPREKEKGTDIARCFGARVYAEIPFNAQAFKHSYSRQVEPGQWHFCSRFTGHFIADPSKCFVCKRAAHQSMMLVALHFEGSTPNRPCTIEEVCMCCARGNLLKNVTSPLFLVDLETRKARLLSHNDCFSVDLVELNKDLDKGLKNPDLCYPPGSIDGLRAIVFDTFEKNIIDVGGSFEAKLVVETDRVLLPELHCYSLNEIEDDTHGAAFYPGYAFRTPSRVCSHPNVAVFDCEVSADGLPLVKVTEMSRGTEGSADYCMMSSEPLSLTLPAYSTLSMIGTKSCTHEFIYDLWNVIRQRVATLIVGLLRLSPRERGPVTGKLATNLEKNGPKGQWTLRMSLKNAAYTFTMLLSRCRPYFHASVSLSAKRTKLKHLKK